MNPALFSNKTYISLFSIPLLFLGFPENSDMPESFIHQQISSQLTWCYPHFTKNQDAQKFKKSSFGFKTKPPAVVAWISGHYLFYKTDHSREHLSRCLEENYFVAQKEENCVCHVIFLFPPHCSFSWALNLVLGGWGIICSTKMIVNAMVVW